MDKRVTFAELKEYRTYFYQITKQFNNIFFSF